MSSKQPKDLMETMLEVSSTGALQISSGTQWSQLSSLDTTIWIASQDIDEDYLNSIGALQISSWTQRSQLNSLDETVGAAPDDIDEDYSKSGIVWGDAIISTLEEANSTRADIPKLVTREYQIRKYQSEHYLQLRAPFLEKLRKVRQRRDDWNNKGSKRPNRNALDRAYIVLDEFLCAVIYSGRVWRAPFISSDEDGHITIEWIMGNNELHIEISEDSEEYTKVWGINIQSEMHQEILRSSEYINLWDWVNSG